MREENNLGAFFISPYLTQKNDFMASRRFFLTLTCYLSALVASAQHYHLLIGTYTNKGNSEGIYIYDFDAKTAETKQTGVIKNVLNPSYLTWGINHQFIYSVNEVGKNSTASSFKFNRLTQEATFLNKEATGADPCYILTDDKNVITANYSGGSISVFGIKADGSLTTLKQTLQHTGSGPDKRQASAHVHQVLFSPDKKYLIATDLGEDYIYIYYYQADAATPLVLKERVKTHSGSGPRHLTFSPNGKQAYLAHEFNGKISVFSYTNGHLSLIQEIETTVKGFNGKIDGADIHISADGKFLYESNRGDANSLSAFTIQKNGKLKYLETVETLGKGPRNFAIDPSGHYLLVAHQYTNDVIIFNRNTKTGKLTDSGKRIDVGVPVCLSFATP
ncbi:lactonase family protein [Pedobacter sp. ASV28]|uniref:lactonase family protein n=1 Tax=Pedobacter sp. ASV28 TaxID=2795123 RepID=UPI001E514FAF|nr:lactonase family protein [Pedobacter sp. ASV28]